jgi:SPP1 family predicted phage head-tail adaptor
MFMIDAGELDRRIVIQRSSRAPDAMNQQIETWSTFQTVYAKATPVLDGERMRAGENMGSKQIRFLIRYSADVVTVGPLDRVVFEGRTYDINGVKEVGFRAGLEITATARAE